MLLNDTFYGKYFFFCDNPPRFYYNCLTESFENHIAYSFFLDARPPRPGFLLVNRLKHKILLIAPQVRSTQIERCCQLRHHSANRYDSSPSSSRLFPVKKLIFLLHAFFLSSLCFITSAGRIIKPFLNILTVLSYIYRAVFNCFALRMTILLGISDT